MQLWDEAFAAVDHAPLLEGLGFTISPERLQLALTHRSFANEHNMLPNNERLEFLGDAVLGLSVADDLFHRYPDRPESDISRMRAGTVNTFALADVARSLGVGEHIMLGRGETLTGGSDKNSILADTLEALFGAGYLEHGLDVVRTQILRLFDTMLVTAPTVAIHVDWKTELQEKIALQGGGELQYRTTQTGPAHEPVFDTVLYVDGNPVATASGKTKKEAEHHAAKQALESLPSAS